MNDVDTPLNEEDVDPDPFRQFERWFEEARQAGAFQPEAAAVATATPGGAPSVRMVLVKRVDRDGFVFYTNYESRKGTELNANPRAALMFHWEALGRVVRVEGPVERTTREDSLAYAPGIDAKLAFLSMGVAGFADSAPTAAQYQEFDKLKKQTDELLARWEQVRNADLSSFQKLAAEQNVMPIYVPDVKSERVQGGEE